MNRNLQTAFAAALLCWAHAAAAQSFSSGSTGVDGPLNVTTSQTITVRAGGVYNYTTVNVGPGVILRYARNTDNAPLVILASGDVTITGVIDISGANGSNTNNQSAPLSPGAPGGPGGFNGGNSGVLGTTPTVPAAAGQGPAGGAPGATGVTPGGGGYGAPTAFVALTPLFGGSGGGGAAGATNAFGTVPTHSGGGGGGAILIASSTRIIVNGQVRSNGGSGGSVGCSGPGAGGAIRLVAPEITGSGGMLAIRGANGSAPAQGINCTNAASDGRIRVEAFTLSNFTGNSTPIASVATSPGAVSAGGNPQLANVPTLAITSIGGVTVPATPSASYAVPDMALAPGTSNPVPVALAATNTPVGSPTVITVRVMPLGSVSSIAVASADHTGTFASSTASANVTLPVGQVTVLQASAAMTLTGQTASLFPLIDGEPVERVMVAAAPGQPSTLSLVSRAGKEVRVDELSAQDQAKVALAWEAMKATQ